MTQTGVSHLKQSNDFSTLSQIKYEDMEKFVEKVNSG